MNAKIFLDFLREFFPDKTPQGSTKTSKHALDVSLAVGFRKKVFYKRFRHNPQKAKKL